MDELAKESSLVEEPGVENTPEVSAIGTLDVASRYVVVGENENSVGNIEDASSLELIDSGSMYVVLDKLGEEDSPLFWQNEAGTGSKFLGSQDGIVALAINPTKIEPPARQNVA